MDMAGTVYLIDDDEAVRDALGWLLRTRRLLSQGFESAEHFWAEIQAWSDGPSEPCCAVLDLRMPGMSGLTLFDRLRELPWFETLPVIFLSGHADVPTAVDAVLRGAVQFCEKPFSDNQLVAHVEQALERSREAIESRQRRVQVQARIAALTERELAVMQLMAEGLPNKLIADRLDISTRTVEVHRARVFEKMACKSLVELVHLLGQDFARPAPRP
jgi:two-component system, LuxR family, response regulator DctR